jgi:hypothetical protein
MSEGLSEELAIEQYRKIALEALEKIQGLRVDLSETDSDYHREYIKSRVIAASSAMENLSDLSLSLTKVALVVRRAYRDARSSLRDTRALAMASTEYAAQTLLSREAWLLSYLQKYQERVDRWEFVSHLFEESRASVVERMGTIRRIDSDLRLHQRLLEVGSDDVPRTGGYVQSGTQEIDL